MADRTRLRAVVELLAAVAVPAAAVLALHGLGDHPRLRIDWAALDLWLQVSALDDVAAALLRLLGLAAAYWVLLSTGAYLLARALRLPALIGAVEWATLPFVRRAADRVVALVLVGSSLGGHPAAALAADAEDLPGVPPPPAVQVEDPPDDESEDASGEHLYEPTPAGDATPATGEAPPPGTPPPAAAATREPGRTAGEPPCAGTRVDTTPAEARGAIDRPVPDEPQRSVTSTAGGGGAERYEVVAGDNLWAIADATLTEAWGRDPSVGETAGYWRQLIDVNAGRLRSGDPDLIYPGEVLDLPAIPEEDGDG